MKLLLTIMAAALVATPARAEVAQSADVSLQQVHLDTKDGNKSHKFTEYRTMPNGVVLERYTLDADMDNYVLSCEARKVGYDDQDYKCAGGKPGKFTYKFGWDQTPHVFSNQARTAYTETSRGNLELPDLLQNDIQTGQNTPGNGLDASLFFSTSTNSRRLKDYLNQAAKLTPAQTRDDKASIDLRYRPTDALTLTVGAMRATKKGTRPMGASFGFGQPIELLEPIDYETHEMSVGAEFVKPSYQLGASYMLSKFDNLTDTLIWDSFRRLTDQYTNASGYSSSDQSSKGRMALFPSNIAHTFALNGAVELPLETRFSGEVSYAMWQAKREMLPYTINSAMTNATTVAAPYKPPFDASSMDTRPGADIDNQINVYMMNWKLVNKAIHDLKLLLEWKTLAEINKSQQFLMPGHAVFDQRWDGSQSFDTKRDSFHRDRLTFKADYEVSHPVSVGVDYTVERERVTREVPETFEHVGTVASTIRPDQHNLVNVSYSLALRRMRSFNDETYINTSNAYIETPGLRRFDLADRNRNKGRVQWQYTSDKGLLASISAYGYYDKYRPGKGGLDGGLNTRTNSQYGLLEDRSLALATDLTVPVGDEWELGAFYEFEQRRGFFKSNYANSANMTQLAVNEWAIRLKEISNVGALEANWKRGDWDAGAGYELVASVFKEDMVQNGGGANVRNWSSLPDTLRTKHTFRLNGGYKLTKNLKVNGRYMFERYDVNDFANDNIPLQAPDNAIYLGASLRPYRAHIASLGLDYRF